MLSARGWSPVAAETWRAAIAAKASLNQADMESAISAILATADPESRGSADTFALRFLKRYIRRMDGRISGPMTTTRRAREELSVALERWLRGTGLASVRGKALEKLPEDARDQWGEFWTEVDELLEYLRSQSRQR